MYTKKSFENYPLFKDIIKRYGMGNLLDPLTKTILRGHMMTYVDKLISEKKPFSLIIIDIDNFKQMNDNYGHQVGDLILQETANNIIDAVGDNGLVGRYGGDEFIIVDKVHTDYDSMHAFLVDLYMKEENRVFRTDLKIDQLQIFITGTIGAANFPNDATDYDDLFNKADKALYRGKMKGRNCFIIYLAAKHANILIEPNKEKLYSSMEMLSRVFNIITVGDDLKKNIKSAIQYLSSYLMIDHICVQSTNKICVEQVHSLSVMKEFEYIDNDLICREMNSSGLFFLNARKSLMQTGSTTLHALLKSQQIYSFLGVKIEINNKNFGILRADSTNIKTWQSSEMDLFVVAAKLIAVLLDKANTTLDELFE